MSPQQISEFAGLRRTFEVGMRLAPTHAAAPSAAKSLASLMDEFPRVPVRLVELAGEGTRVHITVAVTIGTIDDIKASAADARGALDFLSRIVAALGACDPALVPLPAQPEAIRAAQRPTAPDLHEVG
ncbi:MAG: hypothetical protein ACYC0W_10795 [Candidatus Nanopelagicales bacterium]